MKTWDDWNDSDIDFAVCEITGNIVTTIYESGKTDKIHTAHYCNSWADMGPIIFDNGICLTSPTVGRKSKQWSASWNEDGGRWSSGDIVAGHDNPLRAAAIVFLEMNGVKP